MVSLSFRIGVNFRNRGTIVVLQRYGRALCSRCVLDGGTIVVLQRYVLGTLGPGLKFD